MADLSIVHPSLLEKLGEFKVMYDTYQGSDYIKRKGIEYLPALVSMELDGMAPGQAGFNAYQSYKLRAIFYEYVREGVHTYLGMLCQKPANITVPKEMEYLIDKASNYGEGLQALLKRIYENQLLNGRLILISDVPNNSQGEPYIALYNATSMTNWDDSVGETGETKMNLVVFNESGAYFNPETFEWEDKERYRVLTLGTVASYGQGVYRQGVFDSNQFVEDDMVDIKLGTKTLDEIPIVVINASDLTAVVRTPPLKQIADLALSIYRSEADYRQNLHQQGQDTLVVKGGNRNEEELRLGAGARIDLDNEGDAKFIGVSANGLSEQREAIAKNMVLIQEKAGQFVGIGQSSNESGEAMQKRIASRTVTLVDIALTGCAGLERILKKIAKWKGLDESKVAVTPYLDFANKQVNSQDVMQLVTARNQGFPISLESLHAWSVDMGLTKLTFEEEMKLIEAEKPGVIKPVVAQIDKSTGKQVGLNNDKIPSEAKTGVDKRP